MTIEAFIKRIEEELEDIVDGSLKPEHNYRVIENWSSMYALIIVAIIDEEFGVEFTAVDFNSSLTLEDIYNIVIKKKG